MTTTAAEKVDRVLPIKEVMYRTSLGRSTIYRHIDNNTFPKQISLGGKRVGWLESSIQNWIDAQHQNSVES
ncbi:helix-turn-helix transcriptional regulator [Neptunomonas marina]|uniref:AlpA family transcriptional regulator n=1 Tax=Neptunomonas marina TaxID=1815562 RepID=A0A437QDP2_9GAMM|nr:AlpA family transcriptional regulator [Neptunomonas marina]RVU32672.1 AlpA family transcriptional regulator [Neptunomonas marina]